MVFFCLVFFSRSRRERREKEGVEGGERARGRERRGWKKVTGSGWGRVRKKGRKGAEKEKEKEREERDNLNQSFHCNEPIKKASRYLHTRLH